jgi:A/G-specific adenine glycosylase
VSRKGSKSQAPSSRRNGKAALPLASGLKSRFQRRLLGWYKEHGRDLPWRKTSDPYKILVSEVMLQQTQVDRVIPKYHEFLERYPSFNALAEAQPNDVKKTWYPLGYNIRPLRLHGIARETVARYGGELPNDHDELLSFKGIGRYTAGAIRSFAFNEDAPILDTNVMRVLHRVFVGTGNPKNQKNLLWEMSEALIPKGRGYDFNQALMDFGATVCTARDPYCLLCPMKGFCKTYPFDETSKV